MWFNIIPPYAIITGCFAFSGFGLWWTHYLVLGNHYRRNMFDLWERRCYQRDGRITNNPYKVSALDAIPDKLIKEY